jgi:hypothetical protein
MLKPFSAVCALIIGVATVGCSGASHDTPVTPTVGTVATAQGVVMAADTYLPLSGAVVSIGGVTFTTASGGTYEISGLKPGDAILTVERQGFQNFSALVSLDGARTFNVALSPSDVPRYAGNWRGTWTTGAKTGGLVMAILVDTIAERMSVALDIGGNIVPDFDPPGETYNGAITAPSIHFSQRSPVFGNITADITTAGQISGQVTQVPLDDVSRFTFNGAITASTVNVNYAITFNDNTTENGSATLTR